MAGTKSIRQNGTVDTVVKSVIEAIPRPLILLDEKLKIVCANSSFCEHRSLDPSHLEDLSVFDMGSASLTPPDAVPESGNTQSNQQDTTLVAQVKGYAIFRIDPGGPIVSWNEGCKRVLGYDEEEFLELELAELFTEEDRHSGFPARELDEAAQQASASDDRWMLRKGGIRFWAAGLTTALHDGHGKLIGFTKVLRDQTDLKVLEERREAVLDAERAARTESERANRLKDEFLATLSHELRTPLNAILGWVHILTTQANTPEELAEALAVIERNARAQAELISDLLDMSSITSGKLRLAHDELFLAKIIHAAVETVHPAAQSKRIQFVVALESQTMPVIGDAARLQQVFWNLLSNAVKFTPFNGRVGVALTFDSTTAQVEISDTGKGIHAQFLEHLFDRFQQEDSSSARQFGGMGIGLSIVKSLVELHGGTISAESPGVNLGSTFRVEFPLSRGGRRELGKDVAEKGPMDAAELAGIRVLIVDDEIDSLGFFRRVLREREAHVTVAKSAREAFNVLKIAHPDIIVSDIGMPDMDGYQFIEELHANDVAIPAIAVTAYSRSEDRLRALRAGYQAHISKPVDPVELITTISTLCSNWNRGKNTTNSTN